MPNRSPEVQDWLSQWPPDQREQVEWLASKVHAATPDGTLAEAVKWRRLTFTAGEDWHHWLCAIAVTARAVNLVFHKGVLLTDPAGLLAGDGRYIRQVSYEQAAAHPDAVAALVREALTHQTDMLPEAEG
jgi:hypothetical protein